MRAVYRDDRWEIEAAAPGRPWRHLSRSPMFPAAVALAEQYLSIGKKWGRA